MQDCKIQLGLGIMKEDIYCPL